MKLQKHTRSSSWFGSASMTDFSGSGTATATHSRQHSTSSNNGKPYGVSPPRLPSRDSRYTDVGSTTTITGPYSQNGAYSSNGPYASNLYSNGGLNSSTKLNDPYSHGPYSGGVYSNKNNDSYSYATINGPNDSRVVLQLPPTPTRGPPVAPEETRSTLSTALIMSALCTAVFLAALDTTIITTALPTIAQHFESAEGYTWIGSGYLLGAAASTPIWGKISDIFGRKPVLLAANVVFFVASLLSAVAVSISMLVIARVVQGIGGGGLIVLVNICIGDLFSIKARGQYYGLIGATWALASATGPLIGGAFTQGVSWRWCFYINLPLDGVAFVIIVFCLNNLHVPKTNFLSGLKAIDWIGSLLMVGGTLMVLLGLHFGGESHPWDSAIVVCLILAGIVCMGLFAVNEWCIAKYPIVPLHIFCFSSNIACLGVCFSHGVTFMGGAYYLPLYFQACLGASPIMSGVYSLATAVPLSLSSVGTGFLIKKTGNYLYPIIFGMVFMTLGFGLFVDLEADSPQGQIIAFQIIAGLGVGPLFQSPLIALQSLVPKGDIAAATATFQFTRNIAMAVSVVIGGVVFQNTISARQQEFRTLLGPENAERLSGFNAGANVDLIGELPNPERDITRDIFGQTFKHMWTMYVCFAALGLLTSLLITRQVLSADHETTKTGLEAEEEKRKEREEWRRSRKSLNVTPGGLESGSRIFSIRSSTFAARSTEYLEMDENGLPKPPRASTFAFLEKRASGFGSKRQSTVSAITTKTDRETKE